MRFLSQNELEFPGSGSLRLPPCKNKNINVACRVTFNKCLHTMEYIEHVYLIIINKSKKSKPLLKH